MADKVFDALNERIAEKGENVSQFTPGQMVFYGKIKNPPRLVILAEDSGFFLCRIEGGGGYCTVQASEISATDPNARPEPQNPRRTKVEWVEKIDADFPDSAPLTGDWLRKVGLWGGLKTCFVGEFGIANDGSPWVASATKYAWSTASPTIKTIGEARQLCRLLGVDLKEGTT